MNKKSALKAGLLLGIFLTMTSHAMSNNSSPRMLELKSDQEMLMRELQAAEKAKNSSKISSILEKLHIVNEQLKKYEKPREGQLKAQKEMLLRKMQDPAVAKDFEQMTLLLKDLSLIDKELQEFEKINNKPKPHTLFLAE